METRDFGTTNRPVSPIGLGLAAVGRPAYLNLGHHHDLPGERSIDQVEAHTHQLLDRAWTAGVRYVDVARSYGLAERFLADWLEDHPDRAATCTIGSKWGYTYVGDWQVDAEEHEVKDHSLATFARQVEESRALLGDHLDLYHIHSATLETGVLDDDEVLAALADLAGDGVVVGLSVSGPGQAATIRRALRVAATGRVPFASVQATWNPLEPSTGAALRTAADAGWGVIVKEAVANGRLTPRGNPPGAMDRLAHAHDTTVDAIAIAAALAQPFRPVVLSGAATTAHLDANLGAIDLDLDPSELETLSGLAEPPEQYWSRRADLAWT